MKIKYPIYFLAVLFFQLTAAQDIELYEQFNGRYDYTAIGNTLNLEENNGNSTTNCNILTSSSAVLNMDPDQDIQAAYLYWAGSGNGDFDVELNGQAITAQRTFSHTLTTNNNDLNFFAAFAEVTGQINNTINATYTLSELDLQQDIQDFCFNATNFGGWAIIIIYEEASLPLNQVSVFDGLQGVSVDQSSLNIDLNNLSVVDDIGAKIGFLAWEGDQSLGIGENLRVNGIDISNPPLNPLGNAFNGTNSFTGASDFFNMDLDFYDIENNIDPGDTSASISLTTGNGTSGDLILINNVITVLNSTLPDPTPQIDNIATTCFSSDIVIDYTVNNFNCTAPLPPSTPILFYVDGQLGGQTQTQTEIPIDGSESGQINLTMPVTVSTDTEILMVVNNDVNGNIVFEEINENNNETTQSFFLPSFEFEAQLEDLEACDETDNNQSTVFDLTQNTGIAIGSQTGLEVNYFTDFSLAENNDAAITNPSNYLSDQNENPEEIFVRLTSTEDADCYMIDSFLLNVYFTPLANQGDKLTSCTLDSTLETDFFDLTNNESLIINNQPNTQISYHTSADNALNDIAIADPENFQNDENPQEIFVKLANEDHPECYTVTSFEVEVTPLFIGEIQEEFNACDADGEEAIFDLTINDDLAIDGQLNTQAEYFTSFALAEDGSTPITDPENFQNGENPQEIFIRVSSTDNTDCYLIDSFILNVFDTPEAGIPENLTICDDTSNNETEIFNLTENSTNIINNQPNTSISYYLTEDDALNFENEITNPTNFSNTSNSQNIYVRLTNELFTECFSITNFSIEVLPISFEEVSESLLLCDEGLDSAVFDLTEIEDFLNLNQDQLVEGYYLTREDAGFQNNPITTPTFFQNEVNPQQMHIRVEEADNCYTAYSFMVSVENCEPWIPDGFSPNEDGVNETFEITGLYDIFEDFELKVFNRHGVLIYQGDNDTEEWDGTSNEGLGGQGNQLPSGTYFYILNLNDPNFDIYRGWVYLNR